MLHPRNHGVTTAIAVLAYCFLCSSAEMGNAQQAPFPSTNLNNSPGTGTLSSPQMVPINPGASGGVPSTTPPVSSPAFDAYSRPAAPPPLLGGILGANPSAIGGSPAIQPPYGLQAGPSTVLPPAYNSGQFGTAPSLGTTLPAPSLPPASPSVGGPAYSGPYPLVPGAGQSATINSFPNIPPSYNQPGAYPYNAPSALFPGAGPAPGSGPIFGGFFNNMYNSVFGVPGTYGQPPNGAVYGASPYNNSLWNTWNPQGTIVSGSVTPPGFIRLFQGPRFRHAYIFGNDDQDGLAINDSDLALAFAIPNFLFSTQPLYLMPSFSLHQWDGPHPAATADLPPLAYSAFLDSGWQSDPARILGAELGLRVGMFSDFDTAITDSLRIMGRGIGRVRLTPRATLKAGVIYLDRNRVKLLPAGGILWQPQVNTRLDIFFPEPKLSSYLTTIGNVDTWWYAGGYYGGGAWTIQRADSSKDSIDINDLRIVFGLEFGRNEAMREGRRNGFIEVGYVFDRELHYDNSPLDNMDLQDTVMIRAGIGY